MLSCPKVQKRIRGHYDLSTPFYRLLWGPHIHHGLWDSDETPRQAQLKLTERLATLAGVARRQKLLDIGCGMGASSIHLAKTRECRCTGITVSSLQQSWASHAARWHGVGGRVSFRRADAEKVELPSHAYDVLWSVECTEHLFDKPRFFERAEKWVKPGGTMAICAWLAGDTSDECRAAQVRDVCEGFLCPSLGQPMITAIGCNRPACASNIAWTGPRKLPKPGKSAGSEFADRGFAGSPNCAAGIRCYSSIGSTRFSKLTEAAR